LDVPFPGNAAHLGENAKCSVPGADPERNLKTRR
jgi:hypothetical protein